jgi:hypothetical protein
MKNEPIKTSSHKECHSCGKVKHLDEFSKHPKSRAGYTNQCKLCTAAEMREWRKKNQDKVKETNRRSRNRNAEKNRECNKRWVEEHKEDLKIYYQEYRLANRERIRNNKKMTSLEFSQKVVHFMGGKCQICGLETNYYEVYDCHHINPKEMEYRISSLVYKNWNTVVTPELQKCILVCWNCHKSLTRYLARLRPNKTKRQKYLNSRTDNHKKRCTEYIGNGCQICGLITEDYAKYDFHHTDSTIKKYDISKLANRDWATVLQPELDKCCMLCGNCHRAVTYGRYNEIILTPGPTQEDSQQIFTFDQIDIRKYLDLHPEIIFY